MMMMMVLLSLTLLLESKVIHWIEEFPDSVLLHITCQKYSHEAGGACGASCSSPGHPSHSNRGNDMLLHNKTF